MVGLFFKLIYLKKRRKLLLFFNVEIYPLILLKISAPLKLAKQPDIFSLTLIIRKSRSAKLFVNGIKRLVKNLNVSSL